MLFGKKKHTAPHRGMRRGGVIDGSTSIILAVTPHIYAIRYAIDADPEAAFVSDFTQYGSAEPSPLSMAAPETCVEWRWDWKSHTLSRTDASMITSEIRERASLARARLDTIVRISRNINRARTSFGTGLLFQETVYMTKKQQAQGFKDAGYNEDRALEFPYVLQYADLKQIPMKEAAERILLKAKFDDQVLAKTELLRMKYFEKVKKAARVEELSTVYDDFMLEFYKNAMV